jgi:hypothetical protein
MDLASVDTNTLVGIFIVLFLIFVAIMVYTGRRDGHII